MILPFQRDAVLSPMYAAQRARQGSGRPRLPPSAASTRRRISPAARRLAQEHGIAIDGLSGTGPDGALTLQDVQRALEASTRPDDTDRHREMRRAIAAAMSRSRREIPHYYLREPVPLLRTQAWLAATNAGRDIGGRLLLAVLQLKAVALALALANYPDLNGFSVNDAHQPSILVSQFPCARAG